VNVISVASEVKTNYSEVGLQPLCESCIAQS
jgi:hypothetical protein